MALPTTTRNMGQRATQRGHPVSDTKKKVGVDPLRFGSAYQVRKAGRQCRMDRFPSQQK